MWLFLLGMGVSAVAYGLRGERIPGKIITIAGNTSDNGIPVLERIYWVALGIAAIIFAAVDFRKATWR